MEATKEAREAAEENHSRKRGRVEAVEGPLEEARALAEDKLPVARRRLENVHAKERGRLERDLADLEQEFGLEVRPRPPALSPARGPGPETEIGRVNATSTSRD